MEEGSPTDRIVLIIILVLGIAILIKRTFNWRMSLKENPALIVMACFILISILWSDMPFVSLKRGIRDCIAIVMALVIASEQYPRKAIECILKRTMYLHIPFSIILIKYFPQLGVAYGRWSGSQTWVGVCTQKNDLALLCMITIFFYIWKLFGNTGKNKTRIALYKQYIDWIVFFLAIWIFLGPNLTISYSVTSSISLIIGIIALFILRKKTEPQKSTKGIVITFLIIGIIIYGTLTPFLGKLTIYDPSTAFGRNETITGRSDIWAYLTPYAEEQFFLGHGFGGFWTDSIRAATSSHAHNGYLDIILNLGIIGLIIFSMFLVSICIRAQRMMHTDSNWAIFMQCIILMGVIHNIAESSIISLTGILPSIMLFMLFTERTKEFSEYTHLDSLRQSMNKIV